MLLSGCTKFYHRKTFAYNRNFETGKEININYYHNPIEIIPYDSERDKYIFEIENKDGKCKWESIVKRKTKIVESWKYISPPEDCWEEINWWGPW